MKVSVSLSESDAAFLDQETRTGAFESRSAAVQAGIRLLRERELARDYASAFDDWSGSDDEKLWDGSSADGLNERA
jgi:putative addiction module CopG family antidote